jgi:hypothetical protein
LEEEIMSDVETKKLYKGESVQAEADLDTGKPIGCPIYFRALRNGHYLTLGQAEALERELGAAIRAVRNAGG